MREVFLNLFVTMDSIHCTQNHWHSLFVLLMFFRLLRN